MSWLLPTVAALLLLRLAAQLGLALINRREVERHVQNVPPALAGVMEPETYRKSVRYTLAKNRFGMLEDVFDALVLAAVLFSGFLPWFYQTAQSRLGVSHGADAVFLFLIGALLSLPSLPLEWWAQFRLEQRFGFNRSTQRLWWADRLKGLLLGAALGIPLLWILLSLVDWAGPHWWLWAFALFFGFQLLMMILYPKLILPLFNKLTPLPEGPLRQKLLQLADRTGFQASTIEVIDGSKRSAHSNAFFTGFGRFRRIVLFDTLLQQLEEDEIAAVLAHEIGHYKRGHIPRMLLVSALTTLAGFWLIAWLAESAWFASAFGFESDRLAPAFLLFGLLSGLVTFWFSPLLNTLSRRHEYQADAFARQAMGAAQPLMNALRKLVQKNLSNLTPHPLFSWFYYSHPTLVERERSLQSAGEPA